MTEKKCQNSLPFNTRTLVWITGLSFLIPCVLWCIRAFLAPAPVLGILVVVALFAGIIYCVIKHPAWVKTFPNGEQFINWANKQENEPKLVFGFLASLNAFTFIAMSLIV